MTIIGQGETHAAVDAGQVKLALQQALASQTFRRSERMCRFLTHAVEATLANETSRLKEVCIGIEVFGRLPGYNPKLDPVVRNEARRLRSKLEQYYGAEGAAETLRITIPRGAYIAKFAMVEIVETPETAVEVAEEPHAIELAVVPAAPQSVWRKAWVVAAAVALLGALMLAYVNRTKADRFTSARFSYLTSLPTREVHPSISPDGQRVLYSSDQNGNYNIYVATLDGQSTRLTRNESTELHPAWSPDGQLFAFLRVAGEGFDVIVRRVAGGPERKVARVEQLKFGAPPTDDVLLTQGSPGPAWSQAGTELVFTSEMADTSNGPLHVLQLSSGQQRVLTHPPKGVYDFYPAYSPDGKWLAFCRLQSSSTANVFVMPADGGAETQVTHENQDLRGIAWMPDGKSLVASSNRAGPQRLWRVDVPEGRVTPFPTAGTSARDPSVSRDGKWVVHGDYMLRSEIWQVPIQGGSAHSLSPSTRQDHSAQYAPDSNRIAFISDRSGSWELWTMQANGSGLRQLTHFDGPLVGSPRWSPDGNYLAFDARPRGHSTVFVIASSGGTPRVLDEGSHEDKMPSWSHDGKWIYFNSDRGGSQQLWKIPASGGPAVVLAREYAMDSLESPDRRTVYFLGGGPAVRKVSVEGGVAETVRELSEAGFEPRHRMLSLTDNGIWFMGQAGESYGLWLYDFKRGQVTRKAGIEPDAMLDIPGLSVNPDGSTLLYTRRVESRSDLMLVRNLQRP
ncbi:MAG: hypothetical protein WDO73_19900 [Ignavibacteriota bacterium]